MIGPIMDQFARSAGPGPVGAAGFSARLSSLFAQRAAPSSDYSYFFDNYVPGSQMARDIAYQKKILEETTGIEEQEKKEEKAEREMFAAMTISETISDLLGQNYYANNYGLSKLSGSAEAYRLGGYYNDEEWAELSGEELQEGMANALDAIVEDMDGNIYIASQDAEGNIIYHRVNEDGTLERAYDSSDLTQAIPAGAPTFDTFGGTKRIYVRTDASGQKTFVDGMGNLIDDAKLAQVRERLARAGKSLDEEAGDYNAFMKSDESLDGMERLEQEYRTAENAFKTADQAAAGEKTYGTFINREQADLQLKIAGAQLAAYRAEREGEFEKADKLREQIKTLQEDAKKMNDLKTELQGKTPEEQEAILKQVFGDRWQEFKKADPVQKAEQDQVAPKTPDTAMADGPRPPSLANEYGLEGGVKAPAAQPSAAFNSAAPAPAPAAPQPAPRPEQEPAAPAPV